VVGIGDGGKVATGAVVGGVFATGAAAMGTVGTFGCKGIGAGAGVSVTVVGAAFDGAVVGATGKAVVATVGVTLGVMHAGGSTLLSGFPSEKLPVV
jgi:hypothetical protein